MSLSVNISETSHVFKNLTTDITVTYKVLIDKLKRMYCHIITRTTQYFNKIQKNSNSEQHFDCFIESTFRLGSVVIIRIE